MSETFITKKPYQNNFSTLVFSRDENQSGYEVELHQKMEEQSVKFTDWFDSRDCKK